MKAGSIINLLVLIALSAGLVLGSFSAFPPSETSLAESSDLLTELESTGSVSRNDRDRISLLTEASATWAWDPDSETIRAELEKGALFFSTLANDFSVEVSTPFARVESQNSRALVSFNEETQVLEVYALDHPTLVTFVLEGKDLNAINVPSGMFMKIPASKITSTLERLRLTKLTKEFPVFEFEESSLSEEALAALEASQNAYDASELSYLQNAQENSHFGPSVSGLGSYLNKAYSLFREGLTVLPSAEERLNEQKKVDTLVYGMTNLLYGEKAVGETWIFEWQNSQPDLEEVDVIYSSVFFALPGDELYPVKAAAAELLFPQEEPLVALRRQFQEIEGLLERGSLVEAQSAYQNYQEKFEEVLNSGSVDEEAYLDDISREYALLEGLLRGHSVFYTGDSVKLLAQLETKILSLAGSDQDLDEERQAFVQSKLRYLENLFSFVMERKVSVEDATDLASELVADAEKYLSAITSEVAVRSYFESKIEEYDLSVQFINSPEFYSYDDFDEGLKEYEAKILDLEDLNEYLQSLRSGDEDTSATVTLEEATAQVEAALRSNGIQYKEVKSLGDTANRLFEIEGGRTGGYEFEANYDRETQILYDTVVAGEVRFAAGLSLETANEVIENAMKEAEIEEEEETAALDEEEESLTEEVAISRVEAAFEAAEIDPLLFDFEVVDLEENTFMFDGILTEADIPVKGTYDLDTELVTNLVWELDEEVQTFPDVELSQFESALYATYQALSAN